jgi:uncharacterized protein (DUF1499 family)
MIARMSVSREVAEHCLAHVLPGVEKVSNRYNYLPQKREAFEKQAELVERIVTSLPRGNVVSINRDAAPAKNVRHLHRRPCAATYRA